MGEHFYALADMKPPVGVKVQVLWDGRLFVAARVAHPETKREAWLVEHNRVPVFLPLSRAKPIGKPWEGWHTLSSAPQLWAPCNAKTWRAPLPAPSFEMTGDVRMWNAKQSFNAAEAAAEMEADRENASRETVVERTSERVAQQWWRDHVLIKYEPRDSLTKRMAEGRIMRAIACCGVGRGLTLENVTASAIVAAMAEAVEAAAKDAVQDYAPRFEQLPQDRDDWLTAMQWFTAIDPPNGNWTLSRRQRVMLLRALPMPWSYDEIGDDYRISGERARQIYARALDRAYRMACQGVVPAIDRLEALRERNRRYHLGAA